MSTDSALSLSHAAIAALRQLIEAEGLSQGDKLPPERQLIKDLNISRSTLRKALDTLEREGSIWRHVGKGTFVSGTYSAPFSPELTDLSRQMTPLQMIRARITIEPAIAREAALNASDASLTAMKRAKSRAEEASTWAEYESEDTAFHRSIALATENTLLLLLFDQLNQIQRSVAWDTVVRKSERPAPDHTSFDQHNQIVKAIESRDPATAQDQMQQHIGAVSKRLFGSI